MVQGSYGCIFPREGGKSKKRLRLPFAARRPQGHVAFFNYSCTSRDSLEVDFRHLSFTLLNTGPAVPLTMSVRDPESRESRLGGQSAGSARYEGVSVQDQDRSIQLQPVMEESMESPLAGQSIDQTQRSIDQTQ